MYGHNRHSQAPISPEDPCAEHKLPHLRQWYSIGSWAYSASDEADYDVLMLGILRSLEARLDFKKQME